MAVVYRRVNAYCSDKSAIPYTYLVFSPDARLETTSNGTDWGMRLLSDSQVIECPTAASYELIVDVSESEQRYIENCSCVCAYSIRRDGDTKWWYSCPSKHENDC